ncbi:MAG: 3-isopropylmalate dehydrogenase [Desulfobacterales bacterium]|jgi:3-isopropylmalate dehydrogenase
MSDPKHYTIGILPGDGTGPEVVREGIKVMTAVSARENIQIETVHFDLGGERYLKTGEILPESVYQEMTQVDAILLGAIGHPDVKPGILEKGLLLELRFRLDQYINLRPVILYPGVETPLKDKGPDEINFVVVRENTEGLYAGGGGFLKKGTPQEVAIQESINTRFGVERCLRYAFDYCRRRNQRKQLTLCGKTNVLTYAFDLWERTFTELAGEYEDITTDYGHVDAVSMWMIKNPEWFDVLVTDNMFGDIITDIGAMIQGGLGIAAGGNINPEGVSMFEPIGGSAPKYTGQNVINPLACIGAVQMLFEHLGETAAAQRVETGIKKVVAQEIRSLASGKMGHTTSEVGDLAARHAVS